MAGDLRRLMLRSSSQCVVRLHGSPGCIDMSQLAMNKSRNGGPDPPVRPSQSPPRNGTHLFQEVHFNLKLDQVVLKEKTRCRFASLLPFPRSTS